jgi:4-amino-4-deoxy-L-arabinose transferase-like glycosyltransferase
MDANTPGHLTPPGNPASGFLRSTGRDLLVIVLLWSLAIIMVRPSGEFPLNDDWSMGITAKRLAEGEGYHPTGWTEMSLLTHALWGALFCLPNGFSFTALRCSTLVMSLGGAVAMYALIRQLQRPRLLAVLCALTLVFNPLYFALSNTFMTDVPFTTLAILAALFFVRHLQKGANADLVIATAFALGATLSRQMGLCLPAAFGLTLWLKQGFQWRGMIRAVLPALACLGALAAFQYWLKVTDQLPALSIQKVRLMAVLTNPLRIPMNVAYFGWSMLMYVGWFLLPVTLPAVWRQWRDKAGAPPCYPAWIALGLFLAASGARFLILPGLMPVHNNVLIPQGIGPATLRDTLILHLPNLPALPTTFWLLVTGISLIGAALLVFATTRSVIGFFPKRRFTLTNSDEFSGIFLLLCVLVYLGPFLLCGFFDRYVIPITAFLAAFIAVFLGKDFKYAPAPRFAAILLIAASGIFAIAGTRDYLEWNRTRWQALHALLAQPGIRPQDVDGGFEYNGWYLFDNYIQTNGWKIDATYVISFGAIEGFETVSSYDYQQWLPPAERKIFVLRRQPEN